MKKLIPLTLLTSLSIMSSIASANCDALPDAQDYTNCVATELAILRLSTISNESSDNVILGQIDFAYRAANLMLRERPLSTEEPSDNQHNNQ